jgi:hypothetical protein
LAIEPDATELLRREIQPPCSHCVQPIHAGHDKLSRRRLSSCIRPRLHSR